MMIKHVVLSNLSGFKFPTFFRSCLLCFSVGKMEVGKAIRDDASVMFCRKFLLLEWERSLPATQRGGAPCIDS